MMGRHHVFVGAGVGVAVTTVDHGPALFSNALGLVRILGHAPPSWLTFVSGFLLAYVVGVFFSAAFALLPDIDSHASTLGKVFPDWARFLTDMEHRGWTHWWGTGLAVAGVVWLCCAVSAGGEPASGFFTHLTLGGYLVGHLLCDLVTTEGLPLDPFGRLVVRLPLRFNAGSAIEPFVAASMVMLAISWSTGLLGWEAGLLGRLAGF